MKAKKEKNNNEKLGLRRYTFKLYPNVAQSQAIEAQRKLHGALYNALIEQRIDAWHRGDAYERALGKKQGREGGVTLTAFDQGHEITGLRAEMPEYAALSRGSLEQTVKRVDLAFQAFFRRAKAGEGAASGFPRYKRVEGFGFREMSHGGWKWLDDRASFQGIPGCVRLRGCFPADPVEVRTCEFMLREDAWWLSVVVAMIPRMLSVEHNTSEIKFDLIDNFVHVKRLNGSGAIAQKNATYDNMEREAVEDLQQSMARCKRGSNRYRKLRRMKAKREAHGARQRREVLHAWTTAVVRENAKLFVVAPQIKSETKTGRGSEKRWGAAVKIKADLNRHVLQQAPAAAIAMLEYKMAERGSTIEVTEDATPPIAVGNDTVVAGKAIRRARRIIKKESEYAL